MFVWWGIVKRKRDLGADSTKSESSAREAYPSRDSLGLRTTLGDSVFLNAWRGPGCVGRKGRRACFESSAINDLGEQGSQVEAGLHIDARGVPACILQGAELWQEGMKMC